MGFQCNACNQTFSRNNDLLRHQRTVHGNERYTCGRCGSTFRRNDYLSRHMKKHTENKQHSCTGCGRKFYRKDKCVEHQVVCLADRKELQNSCTDMDIDEEPEANRVNIIEQSGEGQGKSDQTTSKDDDPCHVNSAMKDSLKEIELRPRKNQKHDLNMFLHGKRKQVMNYIVKEQEEHDGIKWYMNVQVRFIKYKVDEDDVISEPHFRSKCYTEVNLNDLQNNYDEAEQDIIKHFTLFQREGSGWVLDEILHMNLHMAEYKPVKGSSYIPLPKKLRNKKAIINIQNNDNKCFMWSVLAAKHKIHWKDKPERIHHYEPYTHDLNFDGIEFPVSVRQINKFERQNNISINVFGYEDKKIFPRYLTKETHETHVNLLHFSSGSTNHYCLIKNLDRFLSSQTKNHNHMYRCYHCLHGFVRQDLLNEHLPHCRQHGGQRIHFPDEDDNILKFKDFKKQLKVPFVIYADFESLTCKIESTTPNPSTSYTEKYQHHQPCGFSYVVVSEVDDYCMPPVVYRGPDAVDKFLEYLSGEEQVIQGILDREIPMNITQAEEEQFQASTVCHICEEELGADKVRDHDHLTGAYRGAAHNECNLLYSYNNGPKAQARIPVVLHNLRGYDSHLIMQGLGKLKNRPINCIANNTEKYISFSVGQLDFIDSLQFMSSSLEKLVENLAKEGSHKFTVTGKYIESDKVPLLLRKGVYPYDYMDSFDKFNEEELPSKEAFYSILKDEHIKEEDYNHAQTVWDTFDIRNLGDYHDLYLKSDVLLLADVFENFRSLCLNYYKLDPCHFYTSPGLAWAACLKMTKVELELLTDPDQYLFIEEGLRGGISMISNRYSKANNPYLSEYNPNEEHRYIMYLDANNLYGWAMSKPLPTHEFDWLTEGEIEELDITQITDDSEDGYILEVDLEYPPDLHDSHSDYPLAPEKMKITPEMLSPYSQTLAEDLQLGNASVPKLVPNLSDKKNYIVHYDNLKLYLSLGLQLTKVHRVLTFKQSAWLEPYISFNTYKRTLATNDFEKDFFKLMNNSVFGKTMENLRKRVNVKLINNPKTLSRYVARPSFDAFRIFSEDLAAVNLKKVELKLNRPIYVGFSILEMSKVLMYQFHYQKMKFRYGPNVKLLFTDTDSLCYEIQTDDVYRDMFGDLHEYDTSEYSTTHPLFSLTNKKVLGKMKDEVKGIPIEEFVGLRPKMYSLKYTEEDKSIEKKTAKGISKNVTKKVIKHQDYKDCLFERKIKMANMKQIRSQRHEIYSITLNKIGLSPYDDKRYILEDGINTKAHGHYTLNI